MTPPTEPPSPTEAREPRAEPRKALLGPLHRPAFAFLASGQAVSQLGDGAFRVALILYVVRLTGSAKDLGIVTAVYMIPNIATFFISGPIVDRLPRRLVMMGSDTSRLLFCTGLTILAATSVSSLALVAVLYALFGVADAFFQPAFTAFLPSILSPQELTSANAINASARRAGLVLGPLLGAGLVAVSGPALAFGADAVSFAVSVASLALIGYRTSASDRAAAPRADSADQTRKAAGVQIRDELREATAGARYLWTVSWLGLLTVCAAFVNAGAAGSMDVVFPFYTRSHFGTHTPALGLFFGVQSLGALLGAVAIGVLAKKVLRPGIATQLLLMLMGASVFLLAFTHAIALILVLCISYGLAVEAVGVIAGTLMQLHVPDEVLGRVSAIDYLVSYSLMPLSVFLFGVYLRPLGVAGSFLLAGGAMIVASALPLLNRNLRQLDNHVPGGDMATGTVATGDDSTQPVAG